MKQQVSTIILMLTFPFVMNFRGPGKLYSPNDASLRRVLILGNSITNHGPSPEIGWYGDWGMAASARDKDYVHILEQHFQKLHPPVSLYFQGIVAFERGYWKYDLSNLDSLKALRPDLVILRIGENVRIDSVKKYDFSSHYKSLIDYFMKGRDSVKILCVSSFWKNSVIDELIKTASKEKNCYYLKIGQLSDDPANMALGQFANAAVAKHPSDKGMAAIADIIWKEVTAIEHLQ